MADFCFVVGSILTAVGGVLLLLLILCLLGFGFHCAWIAYSQSFRDICKAESMIHEYKMNREKYFEWRYEVWKRGQTDGK